MGKFKGTNGNWEYHGGDNNSIDIVLPDETTVSIDRVSRYTGKYVLSREGMEANAKLIAAAPEMLEQLKESISVISWYMDNTKPENSQHSDFFNIGMNQRQILEDLISKATE